MKSNGKYLFDECIGRHVMNQLRELVCADAAEFVHLTDYFREGIPDEEWIPKLGGSAGLILITSDGGRQSKRGSKLPDLCIEYKLTHVVMSPKLHAMKAPRPSMGTSSTARRVPGRAGWPAMPR